MVEKPRSIRRWIRLARVGGAVAALTGLSVLGLSHYPDFARIETVRIEGNAQASTVALRHLADVHEGDALLFADLDVVVDQVVRHPWVADATVHRVFPHTLVIEVEEHHTEALLVHRGLYRINAEGEVFARSRVADLDAPLLTGLSPELIEAEPVLAQRLVDEGLRVLGAVRDSDSLALDAVSEVHFDRTLGYSVVLRNGTTLLLGYRDAAECLARLDAMTRSGLDLTQRLRIDLDLDDMAVATPLSS